MRFEAITPHRSLQVVIFERAVTLSNNLNGEVSILVDVPPELVASLYTETPTEPQYVGRSLLSNTVNHLLDDTSADYEQFETELLSKDRDAANVDTLAALTRFGVEIGHLEGPLQLCARCSLGGLATYWTRDLEEHLVATPAE